MRRQSMLGGHAVTRCPACGLYALQLTPARHDPSHLDRTQFEGALRELRLANYQRVLATLAELTPLRGRALLDVGCSNGWFLEQASRAGCVGYGIEPDAFFFERARGVAATGVRLVHGYFPADLPAEWGPFDIITFHDVFEHLPNPAATLRGCRERLAPGGCVALSLPMADGFVFRLVQLLSSLGVRGPLARVFQINYPYPHLFYFSARSVEALARCNGFELVRLCRLRSFSARGALHRARFDQRRDLLGGARAYTSAVALVAFALLERLLPADSALAILRPLPT